MTAQRRNITQPADWWAAFEEQAWREGMTLSEWIGQCCAANLKDRYRRKLSERQTVGRPKVVSEIPLDTAGVMRAQ